MNPGCFDSRKIATAKPVCSRLICGLAVALLLGLLAGVPGLATGEEAPATTEATGIAPSTVAASPAGTASAPDSAAAAPADAAPAPATAAPAPATTAPAPASKAPPDTARVTPQAAGAGEQVAPSPPPAVTPAAPKAAAEKSPAVKSPAVKSAAAKSPAVKSPAVKSPGAKSPGARASRTRLPSSKRSASSSAAKRAPAKSPGTEPPVERADSAPERRHVSSSGASSPASSSGGESEADRVAREIERTTLWMGRANSVVPRSRNGRANELLGSADQFQQDARSAYDLRQFARAQRLTIAARDYADRATRIVGPATDDPEYVKSVLERTDDALDRLKDVLRALDGSREERVYESLKDDQKDAWKQFHGGDVRGGYSATVRVRDGVLAVLQRLPEVPISCDAADKAIKNAEGSRERAVGDCGARPPAEASKRLAQADGQLTKAHAYLARGDCKEALLRAKAAEQQLERAVDAARPSR